jgi:hypothetical protein
MACYCSGDIEDHDTGNEFVLDCTCCLDRDERHAIDDQDWQAGDRDEPESLVMYCGYPGCLMPAEHFRSECHNAHDVEEWFAAHEKKEKPTCQRTR